MIASRTTTPAARRTNSRLRTTEAAARAARARRRRRKARRVRWPPSWCSEWSLGSRAADVERMMEECHRLHVIRRATVAALLTSILGCTRRDLPAIDDVNINLVDNLLQIKGTVCTDPPEPTNFPVKILFVIDSSGSMQFIDNPTRRALAVEEVILRLRANPAVSFGIIRFNEADAVLTRPAIGAGDSNPCQDDCVCVCDNDGDGDCDHDDFSGIPGDPDCNGQT